jgi:hypothetical protein
MYVVLIIKPAILIRKFEEGKDLLYFPVFLLKLCESKNYYFLNCTG